MSYRPFSWPSTRSWVDGGGVLTGTGTIFTCRPWAANRPWSCAMYRPAESMAGNALTTMFVFSSLSCGAPPPDPPEHPAASIVTTAADAMSTLRDFIIAPSEIAASHATRDRLGSTARQHCQAAATDCVTMIIMFRTVRHMPNGTTCPDLIALCYQY